MNKVSGGAELTPVDVAIARVRAEVGERDPWPDEWCCLRVGDLWAMIGEIERLRGAVESLRVAVDDVLARPGDPAVAREAERVLIRTGIDR